MISDHIYKSNLKLILKREDETLGRSPIWEKETQQQQQLGWQISQGRRRAQDVSQTTEAKEYYSI